ncbi:MAG: hypothetical protein V3S29_12535, partial [bacterium]
MRNSLDNPKSIATLLRLLFAPPAAAPGKYRPRGPAPVIEQKVSPAVEKKGVAKPHPSREPGKIPSAEGKGGGKDGRLGEAEQCRRPARAGPNAQASASRDNHGVFLLEDRTTRNSVAAQVINNSLQSELTHTYSLVSRQEYDQ